jgi:hypothetical protein
MKTIKDEVIKKLIEELIETYPKNKFKLADKLYELVMNVSENAAQRYYRVTKDGVFKCKNFDVRPMMEKCEDKKDEYRADPMLLVYDFEDDLHRQITAFYGEHDEEA